MKRKTDGAPWREGLKHVLIGKRRNFAVRQWDHVVKGLWFDPWTFKHRCSRGNKSELFSCRVGGGCVTYHPASQPASQPAYSARPQFAHGSRSRARKNALGTCTPDHARDIFSCRDRHDERISWIKAAPIRCVPRPVQRSACINSPRTVCTKIGYF